MQPRNIKIGLTFGAALLFPLAFISSLLIETFWSSPWVLRGLLFTFLMVCGAVLFHFSLHKVASWSSGIPRKVLLSGLEVCLAAGIFFALAIPVARVLIPLGHSVQLIPGEQINEASNGNTVQLVSIHLVGLNKDLDLKNACTGDWNYQKDSWVASTNKTRTLTCRFSGLDSVEMKFRVGISAGVVAIVADQLPVIKEDLYSEIQGNKTVRLDLQAGVKQRLVSAAIVAAWGMWLGWLLFTASLYFFRLQPRERSKPKAFSWVVYSLFLIMVWSLYLIAFWPGFMNPDAQDQWQQMQTGILYDWHPAFHTITFWLITQLWFSPAAVALVQILFLAILIGLILNRLQQNNMPFWMLASILILLILPNYGLAVISLWKDVPYSIAILGFTYFVLLVVESEGEWVGKPISWVGLGVVGALAALYRHNGTPGIFMTLILLCVFYARQRKQLIGALVITLLLVLCVRGPLYRLAGVRENSSNPGLGLAFAHLVARHTRAGTPISKDEGHLLASIRDDNGVWPYDCYSNNPLAFDGKMNQDQLKIKTWELGRLAWQLSMRSPQVTVDHLSCNAAAIFRILAPKAGKKYYPYEASSVEISPDPSKPSKIPGIESLWPEMEEYIYQLILKMYYSKLSWFFFRSSFWMYLLIFAACIANFRTARWGYLLVLLPVLLNTLPLAFISFIQAFRLVMPVMLVSLVFSGYLLMRDPLPTR